MPETPAPVTWEFLEATAAQVAAIAQEPTPSLVLKEGLWKGHLARSRGQLPLDPGLLAIMTPEEVTFLIAYMLVTRRTLGQLYSLNPQGVSEAWIARRNAHWVTSILASLATTAVVMLLLFITLMTNHAQSFPFLVIPMFVVVITLQLAIQLRGTRKFGYGYFEDAVAIAGSRSAGRSCLTKVQMFYASKRGTKPLVGWRRWMARGSINTMAPPE